MPPKSKKKVAQVNGPTNHDPDVLATNNAVHNNTNNNNDVSDCNKNNILLDNSGTCCFCNNTDNTDIQCNTCNNWCHSGCAGLSVDVLKFISNNRYINFICLNCANNKNNTDEKEVSPIDERLNKMEQNIEKLLKQVTNIPKVTEPPSVEKPKSYSEIVKSKLTQADKITAVTPENTIEYKVIIKNAQIPNFSFPEFKLVFSTFYPNMKLKTAYKKHNADITLVLLSEADASLILNSWKNTYFGTNTTVIRPGASATKSVVIKDMPQKLIENEILNEIKNEYDSVSEVTRFKKENKILPVIKVDFKCSQDYDRSIANGITIKNMFFKVTAYQSLRKPLRCYNCNKYGHVSNNCKNTSACSNCGDDKHTYKECSATTFKCVNCKGAHKATSNECPTYKQLLSKLN